MTSQELAKSIEAKKLNKRSKLPLPEPPAIIPFGALIQGVEEDGALARFGYMGELYQCSLDLLQRAIGAGGTAPEGATHEAVRANGRPMPHARLMPPVLRRSSTGVKSPRTWACYTAPTCPGVG